MLIDTNNSNKNKQKLISQIVLRFKKMLLNISFVKKIQAIYNEVKSIRIQLYKEYENTNIESENISENISENKKNKYNNFCDEPLSEAVIELTKRFRKIAGYPEENNDICDKNNFSDKNNDKKYILWHNFILRNSDNESLPKNSIVENKLKISEWTRRKFEKKGIENNMLIKNGYNKTILNLDYVNKLKEKGDVTYEPIK